MTASAGAWYRVGAVNVTNGNQSIIGVGSNWQNDVIAIAIGDAFTTDAKTWYEIIAVNNDASITLDRPFEGASADGRDYAILRNTSGTILTRIAGQIAIQFNQKQLFLDELRDWLTSDEEAVNVTDSHGITRAFKTLNKIQALSGTAATKNVGEEIGDVMAFGALGLGKTVLTTISQANIDDVSFGRNAESFKVANPIGLPAGVYVLIIRRTSAENVTQILHRQDSSVAMYVRSFDAVGGATQWSKIYDDSKLYDQSNIVGTVSQSGGVPTGDIIERGSNPNGEYTKFADGTLLFSGRGDLTVNNASNGFSTLQLPIIPFGNYEIAPSKTSGGLPTYSISRISKSAASITINIWNFYEQQLSTGTCGIAYTGYGRWF